MQFLSEVVKFFQKNYSMNKKFFVLLAALTFGAPVFISSEANAHGGSKDYCVTLNSGDFYGCKHEDWEKKKSNSLCHYHEFDYIDKKEWDKQFGIPIGVDCKKT